MSSLTRRMQRGIKRTLLLGKNLGVTNPKAKDLLARERREANKKEQK